MSNSGNKYKILILSDFNRISANTIIDHVTSFKKYSAHDLFFLNPVGRPKPHWLNLDLFDIIIIHYSIYVLGDYYLNSRWREAISCSRTMKVQFIQDEYRTVYAIHERMKTLKIDILYTCFPESEIEKIYPRKNFPGMLKMNTFTGYVPEYFQLRKPDFGKRRAIDVGYRGRGGALGEGLWWLGSLYQEKSRIAREFLRHTQMAGLKCDISSKEEDRIYGKKWIHFLENCRCTLGTESGASVIDFTGEVERKVKNYCLSHPGSTFEEVQNLFFKDLEGKISMNQISPRAFEAIGCGCCQILFVGRYSGILKPDIHYIPLEKDFSNISEVLEKIKDGALVKKIAQKAYEDIIASDDYSYRTFINTFDRQIEGFMMARGLNRKVSELRDSRSNFEMEGIQNGSANGQRKDSECANWGTKNFSLFRKGETLLWFIQRLISFLLRPFFRLGRKIYLLHPFFLKEKFKLTFYVLRKS